MEISELAEALRLEHLARRAAALAASQLPDAEATEARSLDLARVGLFAFKALGISLAAEPAVRWLSGGADAADRIRFLWTMTEWERRTGGDKPRLRSALARVAGHYPGADWQAMAKTAKAMRAEADMLEKRAAPPGVAPRVAMQLANLASEFREEADRTFALLEGRGWTSAQMRLAPRDFVLACIEVFQLLAPDEEVHSRRDPWRGVGKAGQPGDGFPLFVDQMMAFLGKRPHMPDGWENATKSAVKFWKAKQKAASREIG